MLTFLPDKLDVPAATEELLSGSGVIRIQQVYSPDQIAEARDIVLEFSERDPPRMTHFNAAADESGKLNLQRRVWNLFNKGKIFADMISHPAIFSVISRFLGSEFIAGSYCASRLLPGCPGQEPHIDYPYWDFYRAETFPAALNASFPLNAQATILIDDFTEENGATAFLPGSQNILRYPDENDNAAFFANCERMVGRRGDLVIFYGATWHCAMPNNSDRDRTGLLIEFLPKFVKPVEDMMTGLEDGFLSAASPKIRQLLGMDYPYPELFDDLPGGNAIGRSER